MDKACTLFPISAIGDGDGYAMTRQVYKSLRPPMPRYDGSRWQLLVLSRTWKEKVGSDVRRRCRDEARVKTNDNLRRHKANTWNYHLSIGEWKQAT
jgi:hypothetical protein